MNKCSCTEDMTGTLPTCAPLAMAYVPMQRSATPSYEGAEALASGTLFPGLNLPFMDMVNTTLPACPLTELMTIDFIADELELYLDTHSEDREAFAMYRSFLALAQEARELYVSAYGPIQQSDMLNSDCYTWLRDPWPWDYMPKTEV